MPIMAQGQFTVVDYNDALQITTFLRTNSAKTVAYDPTASTKYNPNWSVATPCEIYPVVTRPKKDGTGIDDITSLIDVTTVKWTRTIGGTSTLLTTNANANKSTTLTTFSNEPNVDYCEYTSTVSTLAPMGIRIKENKMTTANTSLDYMFEAKYKDVATGLWFDIKATISFGLIQNGSNIAVARAYAVGSDTFVNALDSEKLTLSGDLLRGINPDTTISYQWYKMDGSVFAPTTITQAVTNAVKVVTVANITGMAIGGKFKIGSETKTITNIVAGTLPAGTVTLDANFATSYASGTAVNHPDYDANGGVGYAKLANLANHFETVSGTISGSGSCNMNVYSVEVASSQTFKIAITDTESTLVYTDTITIFDVTDPIQVELFSPTGNAIKNGQGNIVISATIKRNGLVVTTKSDGSAYTIKFRKLNKDGSADNTFGTAGYMDAGSVTYQSVVYPYAINVSASVISEKATFVCEIS